MIRGGVPGAKTAGAGAAPHRGPGIGPYSAPAVVICRCGRLVGLPPGRVQRDEGRALEAGGAMVEPASGAVAAWDMPAGGGVSALCAVLGGGSSPGGGISPVSGWWQPAMTATAMTAEHRMAGIMLVLPFAVLKSP